MKNIIFLTACVLCLAAGLNAQKPKVDIAKKIADATPAALPQSPKDDRVGTDAQEANLKGKVKSIAESIIDYENGKKEKTLLKEEFYGEDGNLIRAVDYHDNGYPRGVSVYGYIDGTRVNRWGPVVYFDGEGVYTSGTEMVTMQIGRRSEAKDTRYDIKFTSKYDSQGRLIERTHISRSGEILTHTTYEYLPGNKRLEHDFAGDAKEEIARLMDVFDANGHIVETWYYDEDKKVNAIRTNTYEFDATGNWTVQKTFEKKTDKGKEVLKLLSISYRTITYYP
jgi:hypothetical protein